MKKATFTLFVLIGLTLSAALISNGIGAYISFGILVLAALKFIGVSFYFMDLRKGHPFWKGILIAFLLIFMATVVIIS